MARVSVLAGLRPRTSRVRQKARCTISSLSLTSGQSPDKVAVHADREAPPGSISEKRQPAPAVRTKATDALTEIGTTMLRHH